MYLTPEQVDMIRKELKLVEPGLSDSSRILALQQVLEILRQAEQESERRKYLPSSSDSGLYLVLSTTAELKQQEVRIALDVPFTFTLINRELRSLHKCEVNEPRDFDIFLQHLGRVLQSNMTKALGSERS